MNSPLSYKFSPICSPRFSPLSHEISFVLQVFPYLFSQILSPMSSPLSYKFSPICSLRFSSLSYEFSLFYKFSPISFVLYEFSFNCPTSFPLSVLPGSLPCPMSCLIPILQYSPILSILPCSPLSPIPYSSTHSTVLHAASSPILQYSSYSMYCTYCTPRFFLVIQVLLLPTPVLPVLHACSTLCSNPVLPCSSSSYKFSDLLLLVLHVLRTLYPLSMQHVLPYSNFPHTPCTTCSPRFSLAGAIQILLLPVLQYSL